MDWFLRKEAMLTVSITDARTNLSKLINDAVNTGQPFVIAKAGTPIVTVSPIGVSRKLTRIGFMQGQFKTPDDFDTMLQREISEMFHGRS